MFSACKHIRKPEQLAEKANMTVTPLSYGGQVNEFKCKKCGKNRSHTLIFFLKFYDTSAIVRDHVIFTCRDFCFACLLHIQYNRKEVYKSSGSRLFQR